ncbi:hypothetical protein GCM10027516_29320 [Niabella aquatica]
MHTEGLHHKWEITKMKDREQGLTAYIDLRDVYRAGASAGCRYFSFTPKFGHGNRIKVDNISVHLSRCIDNNTDHLFQHHLEKIYSFAVSGDRLKLFAKNGALLFDAEKAMDDENSSVTRKWYIQQMINGDNEQMLKDKAYLDLRDPDKASASAGCNRFSFSAAADSTYRISISTAISTRMFCKDAAMNEAVLTKVLPLVNKYQVIGNKLKLFDKEDVLLIEAVAEPGQPL